MVEHSPGTVDAMLAYDLLSILDCVYHILFVWAYDNSYRMAIVGRGAFELCLPSLGFFLPKLLL